MTNTTQLRRYVTAAIGLSTALVLASCSQNDPTPFTTPSTSSPTPAQTSTSAQTSTPALTPAQSTPAIGRIDITVTGKKVTPQPRMVNISVGESLTVTVTSDHDNTLHAHGFDIEQPVKAGQRLDITVRGAQPGVYDIELHNPELRLLQVAVR